MPVPNYFSMNRRRAILGVLAVSVAADAIFAPVAAMAQTNETSTATDLATTGVQEIIVTAQKREQRLQDVPVAISAVGADQLTANRITSVKDLAGMVPNLTARSTIAGTNGPIFTIRGELASTTALGTDRGVGYYIDDVYIAATNGALADFAEISRIEVLRGPQGTLFGRNSTAGAVSLHTPEPKDEFGGRLTLTGGNYNQFRSLVTLNTGALGPFSASVSYVHSERRGDIRNLRPGVVWDFSPAFNGASRKFVSTNYLGGFNNESVQAAVKYDPHNGFKAVYRFDYGQSNSTPDGTGLVYANTTVRNILATQDPTILTPIQTTRPDAVNNGNVVPDYQRGYGHNLSIDYQISDSLSVRNITAYRNTHSEIHWADISGVGLLVNNGAPAFAAALGPTVAANTVGAPFLVYAVTIGGSDEQFSNEVQFNYKSDLVTTTVGGLYFRTKQTRGGAGVDAGIGRARSGAFRVFPNFAVPYSGQLLGTGGRTAYIIMKSYAAFGQAEIHVLPNLDLVAGIRYTKDKKNGLDATIASGANPVTFPLTYEGGKVTYNLDVNYKPASDILLYSKYSTGYISGGSIAGIVFGEQTAKSVEGGIKADWFNHILRTNLAVFHAKYDNIQLSGNGLLLTPPRPEVTNATFNSGAARVQGFELETELAPMRGLNFSAGLGYTDFKFTRLDPIVTTGNAAVYPPLRPKWTANLSGSYKTEPLFDDVRLTLRADGNFRSSVYGVNSLPVQSASFTPALQADYLAVAKISGYWIVNSRVSLDGFKLGSANGSVALWARNLFNNRSRSQMQFLSIVVSAQYEHARTIGVDVTVDF